VVSISTMPLPRTKVKRRPALTTPSFSFLLWTFWAARSVYDTPERENSARCSVERKSRELKKAPFSAHLCVASAIAFSRCKRVTPLPRLDATHPQTLVL